MRAIEITAFFCTCRAVHVAHKLNYGHDAFRYEQRTHSQSGIGIKQDVTHFALSYHATNRNAPALLLACDSATTLEKFGASNFYTL